MNYRPFNKNVRFFVPDWKPGRGLHTRYLIDLEVTGAAAVVLLLLGGDTDYLHMVSTIFVFVSDVLGAKNYLGDFSLCEILSVIINFLVSS